LYGLSKDVLPQVKSHVGHSVTETGVVGP